MLLITVAAVLVGLLGLGAAAAHRAGHKRAHQRARAVTAASPPANGGAGNGGTGSGGSGTATPPAVSTRPPAPVSLATGWESQPDPGNIGLSHSWGQGGAPSTGWKPVTMPNDFNPIVTDAGFKGQVWWYKTTFTGPLVTSGRSWQVAFESVRRNATVFLNGYQIGVNHNPYAPFSLPATTIVPRGTNTLIVRVDDMRGAGSFPEDWWNWGGIMGPVTLQPVGRMAIHELGVTPELGCSFHCGDLRVQGTLNNASTISLTPKVIVRVTSPSGHVTTVTHSVSAMKSGTATTLSFPVTISSPQLWSPATPSLYKVDVQTVVGSRVEEDDTLSVGMRSVKVTGGILYLNGKRLWLHGASIHEDVEPHGAALTDDDIRTIVSGLKSLGANITRAHYQLSPRLLNALDQAGIMVWAQPPVDHADKKLATAAGRSQALSMLRSTLIADRNHPSVIVDSVSNELSVTPSTAPGTESYIAQAIKLAKQLNPQVPVGIDVYCYPGFPAQPIYKQLNVIGISDYYGWATGTPGHSISDFSGLEPYLQQQHQFYPGQALVVSEYGAEAFYDGPVTTKGSYEFQSNYVQETYGVLDQLPFMSGSIYWTLREFAVSPGWVGGATLPAGYVPNGIHHKGLLAYDGTPKPAFAAAQALFATAPGYVPAGSVDLRPRTQPAAAFCQSPWCAGMPGS